MDMKYHLQLYGFFKFKEENRLVLPCGAMALKNKLIDEGTFISLAFFDFAICTLLW
jgi:hypothetical protein